MDSADRQFFEREFEFYAKFGLAVSSLLVNISICLLTVSFYQLFKVKFGFVFCILVFFSLLSSMPGRFWFGSLWLINC